MTLKLRRSLKPRQAPPPKEEEWLYIVSYYELEEFDHYHLVKYNEDHSDASRDGERYMRCAVPSNMEPTTHVAVSKEVFDRCNETSRQKRARGEEPAHTYQGHDNG